MWRSRPTDNQKPWWTTRNYNPIVRGTALFLSRLNFVQKETVFTLTFCLKFFGRCIKDFTELGCIHILLCICMGLGHNDTWAELHM